jgi:hypothetical protein
LKKLITYQRLNDTDMGFKFNCEHLISKPLTTDDLTDKKFMSMGKKHYCNTQRDEINNPLLITRCPEGCPFFELKTM